MTPTKLCQTCMDVVCEFYSITRKDMLRKDRHQPLAYQRQIAMSIAYELGDYSTHAIAEQFNREDHGTVLAAISRVRHECKNRDRHEIYANLKSLAVEKLNGHRI